jgi:methyl-accepting chemotaxis protein
LNASIASATLQQAHVVEEINRNVLDTAGLSQQTADAARQSSDAGMALGQLSEELSSYCGSFGYSDRTQRSPCGSLVPRKAGTMR